MNGCRVRVEWDTYNPEAQRPPHLTEKPAEPGVNYWLPGSIAQRLTHNSSWWINELPGQRPQLKRFMAVVIPSATNVSAASPARSIVSSMIARSSSVKGEST